MGGGRDLQPPPPKTKKANPDFGVWEGSNYIHLAILCRDVSSRGQKLGLRYVLAPKSFSGNQQTSTEITILKKGTHSALTYLFLCIRACVRACVRAGGQAGEPAETFVEVGWARWGRLAAT